MSEVGENRSSLVFRGTSANEAEEFIASIHHVARSEGRIRDDLWIADFAVACFRGDALRWYAELDADVQNDWRLLRREILRKYPPITLSRSIESSDQDPIIPTPAAAAAPPESALPIEGKCCWYYRIRVYFDDKASGYILGTPGSKSLFLTTRMEDGVVVFWGPDGRLMIMER
ncbi:hypothetical protein FRC01_012030, partial [Tulasnella sp. 417]